MITIEARFYMVAYTDKGQEIARESLWETHRDTGRPFSIYPTENEIERFANGYQQADYIKVEKEYRYVR